MGDEYPRGFEPAADNKRLSLINTAKGIIKNAAEGWDGPDDGDLMPEMVYVDRDGHLGVVAMAVDMSSSDEKNMVADMMTATLACAGAKEVCFYHNAWTVEARREDDGKFPEGMHDLSVHPDRKEIISLLHYSPDGQAMFTADVIRPPGATPTLSEWREPISGAQYGGRFGDAMTRGLVVASQLPPGAVRFIKQEQAAGRGEAVVKTFMRAIHRSQQMAQNGEKPDPEAFAVLKKMFE